MKKSLSSLDYVKLLFAVVVVAIHTDLFVNYKTGNILFTSFFHRCKIAELKEKSRGETNEYKVHFRNRRCCFWTR